MTKQALRILAFVEDRSASEIVRAIAREEGDSAENVASVDAVIARATAAEVDVVFVDLDADGGSGLALCHLLPTLVEGVEVHVVVSPRSLELGASALSMGAASVLVTPLTGDAVLRILTRRRTTIARTKEIEALERRAARERTALETYQRLIRLGGSAGSADLHRAIALGVSSLCDAAGVALYASSKSDSESPQRLGAVGTALDIPTLSTWEELARVMETRGAREIPLAVPNLDRATLILEAPRAEPADVPRAAELASAVLSVSSARETLGQPTGVLSAHHFEEAGSRLLTLARRHGRRSSVLAVSTSVPRLREEALLAISSFVRCSDLVSTNREGTALIFLPETSALGAHACRRRVLAGLYGERRGRPPGSTPVLDSAPVRSSVPFACGIATFPHDGASIEVLADIASTRASDDRRSPVHTLTLDRKRLAEVVDALIAHPILDAGPVSPFPLDVPSATLFALVTCAYREALRGGELTAFATFQPGLGVAAAGRQVGRPRVYDLRGEPECQDVEVIVIVAEHGVWSCCGRVVGERFRGVHCADPLLGDLLAKSLAADGVPLDG